MTIDIKALRALIEAATPGPWIQRSDGWTVRAGPAAESTEDSTDSVRVCHTMRRPSTDVEQDVNNAAFIAAARTALPAALDRIEELEGEEHRCCDCAHDLLTVLNEKRSLCDALVERAEAAAAEVERLREQVAGLVASAEPVERDLVDQIDRLRAALRRHGRHSQAWGDDGSVLPEACDVYRRKPCSCGLDAALTAADALPPTGEETP